MILFDWCVEHDLSNAFLRVFSYFAPCLLNRLPVSMKELDSDATFNSELKTFMFARVFK